MATEYPPLNRIHVVGYSANDNNFPILNLVADPRVAGYKVPEDYSACPDKRYPNHIFTGAQPISGDQRVRHTWEILPSPWVPFTRYDDDLGPVQGRRRSVKNEGQQASLTSSTRITYEGRDGSAIVLTEAEETWSIATDDDGNSLFPIKIRDFYDPSRGAVEERRQLIVPTGDEVATLENINGVITQTSYEPYNEYLSFKIIQTYAVNGPQLIGKLTNNEGQLVTVTTQRKGSDGYDAPQTTALRTVEVSREDKESLIERTIEAPSVFPNTILSAQRPEVIPERFRANIPNRSEAVTQEGQAEQPVLQDTDIEASQQSINAHTVRVSKTSREDGPYDELSGQEYEEQFDIGIPYTEKISTEFETGSLKETTPVGDGKYIVKEYSIDLVEAELESFYESYPTRVSLDIPRILTDFTINYEEDTSAGKTVVEPEQLYGNLPSYSRNVTVKQSGSISIVPQPVMLFKTIWGKNLRAKNNIFFLKGPIEESAIIAKCGAVGFWPVFKTTSGIFGARGKKVSGTVSATVTRSLQGSGCSDCGYFGVLQQPTTDYDEVRDQSIVIAEVPPCLSSGFQIYGVSNVVDLKLSAIASLDAVKDTLTDTVVAPAIQAKMEKELKEYVIVNWNLPASNPTTVPTSGVFIIDSNVSFYKYGWFLITATTMDASQLA